jgi:hypothetical protein
MFMQRYAYGFALLASLNVGGCAFTNVIPIDPADQRTPGVRYYDVKPLLVLSSSTDKGPVWDVAFIPNFSRPYAVQFGAFLAKNDVNIEFTASGTLAKLGSNMDTTAAIELLKLAAERVLPAAKADRAQPRTAQVTPPIVYEFVFSDRGDLVGLRKLGECSATICPR